MSKLNVVEFGRQTIRSGDLDPLYIALNRVEWGEPSQRDRWLLAYWCLYHAGASSYLSEQPDDKFWHELKTAARNEPGMSPVGDLWPRGKERRHWRGAAAINSAQHLYGRFRTPSDCVAYLCAIDADERPSDPVPVMRRAQTLGGFGPWISFKVADMLDAMAVRDLDFTEAAVFMFEQPQQAALEVWRAQMGLPPTAKPKDPGVVRDGVVKWLLEQFSDLKCPHRPDRGIRLQEVETVLCKWKSHRSGHYPLGNDIGEIGEGLEPWTAVSTVASQMLDTFGELNG